MKRLTWVLLVAAAIVFPVGWVLVVTSGYHGDLSGGSEITWRIGGLMVYAGPLLAILAGVTEVTRLAAERCRRRHAACH